MYRASFIPLFLNLTFSLTLSLYAKLSRKCFLYLALTNLNISDITKELVYGGVGVEKIGYEGEDLEEYYTNLLSEVKSNETA